MFSKKIVLMIIGIVLFTFAVIGIFIYWVFPQLDSPIVSGFAGVLVGAFVGMVGSILTATVGAWRASKETEDRLKDRISDHALQLSRMFYDLQQKSLDYTGGEQMFNSPVKAYRELYRALLMLQTTNEWPREIEELGLLQILPLGSSGQKPMAKA